MVDEDFARQYWPDGSALGQRLVQGSGGGDEADAFTIVGIVAPVKQADVTEEAGQGAVYYPFRDRSDGSLFVVARTAGTPESLAATLQRVVRNIDAELPVNDVRTMDARVAESLVARRSPAVLGGVFAGLALLLTAIGTYGVLSYAVSRRRREIGLRLALGARPQQVGRQFLALGVRLLLAGAALGLAGAWLAGRAMQAVLFNVPALHATTLVVTTVVMGVVTIGACLLPSQRAARVSPLEAMGE